MNRSDATKFVAAVLFLFSALGLGENLPHGDFRLGVALGATGSGRSFIAPTFRLALHDFLDPGDRFPKHTQLEILSLGMRWWARDEQVSIDEMKLLRVVSQAPSSEFSEQSWRIDFGAERIWDRRCDNCLAARGLASIGWTAELSRAVGTWLTVFADGEIAAGGFHGSQVAPGVGPSLHLRLEVNPSLKAIADVFYRQYFFVDHKQRYGGQAAVRLSLSRVVSLQLGWKRDTDYSQASSVVFLYF